jgi:phage anti-repressor protein
MSVDIVRLIESNPIARFNQTYQSKLIEKLQTNFSDYEQQMFLSSFYCYLKYDKVNDFVIDVDNIWEWLGFTNKGNAKKTIEKFFIIDKDYKILLPKIQQQIFDSENMSEIEEEENKDNITNDSKKKQHGGHNKEKIMLNIKTFKRLCMKAGTERANEIQYYFIKLEEIFYEILEEETSELKTQMLQIEDKKQKEYEDKLLKQKVLDREKMLLDEYSLSGPIVYIIRVKTLESGRYVIKLGESRRGITSRYVEHKHKYEECLLLDCFAVTHSKDFESFIHNHENVRLNKVTNLANHENENELFLIGKDLPYTMLLRIINNNLKYFNSHNGDLQLENENLKMMLEMKETNNENIFIKELLKTVKQLSNKIDSVEKMNKEILEKINRPQARITTAFNEPLVNLGPRLQKINPETLELIKVYENVAEVMRENSNIKRPSLNKAIVENRVYCNYRWIFVDRSLDPSIVHNIVPTRPSIQKNIGYIAKLNQEKSEILAVYIDRKTAAHQNNYESIGALDNPVKKFTLTKGHYYTLYDNCSEELRTSFEASNNGYPVLYRNGVGQYDENENLIHIFLCKYYCCNILGVSDKCLTKSIKKNILYNGHFFREIGDKLII